MTKDTGASSSEDRAVVNGAQEVSALRASVPSANVGNCTCTAAERLALVERVADRMREALARIERAPAWGAPDRWETTPAEVRQIAREALDE